MGTIARVKVPKRVPMRPPLLWARPGRAGAVLLRC